MSTDTSAERASATASTRAVSVRQLPRSVWGLAFTELWERFSFYGVNGILSFYLLFSVHDGGLDLGAAAAAGVVGAYGGAVYLAQLAGAWMGDRVLSPKLMVFWGGAVITLGHVALAVFAGMTGLVLGLLLIIFGTGALKTNITNIVGFVLEGQSSAQRDVGFAYFYISISLGSVLGPLSTGFAQNEWGFHWGFGLAAIGMVLALVQYAFSMRRLPAKASSVLRPIAGRALLLLVMLALLIATAIGMLMAIGFIKAEQLAGIVTAAELVAAAVYFGVMLGAKHVSREEKRRVAGFLPLFLAASLFFGLLFQQFTTIAILISERVDLVVGGWSIPVAWITMISQLALVIVTPLVAQFWGRSGNSGPGAPTKFAMGMMQIGIAYAIMLVALRLFPDAALPVLLVVVVMIIAGSSEVFIGPIGLSLATRIGPSAYRSHMVGLNFLTLGLGSSLSGLLGQLFTVMSEPSYFLVIIGLGVGTGILLWLFRAPLHRALNAGLA
ncbi:peptide MFS transporter [Gulosibacter sp. 10]|uniref:peptide MFS transporter n=1 Tax=Gulosibacter sp. 10 TaxID=1255570 RepID=UPI0020CE30DF|nr:oligopeptide:H+ symporter [Gulosibacter sp. 10]